VVVASAEPYANYLQPAADRLPCQHLITKFLQAISFSMSLHNSVRALKAKATTAMIRTTQIILSTKLKA